MEKSFEEESPDSKFGMADSVEAEAKRNKKMLKGANPDAIDDVSMSDSVEVEVI